ncbi:MAG: TolC family protein [Treponema sp.]|jgi:outer membrane protein TolC|nr:TolC family protein [Treponema sp.]
MSPPSRLRIFLVLWIFTASLPPKIKAQGRSISFTDAARMAVAASAELRNEYAQGAVREKAWRWGRRAYFPRLSISASEDDRLSKIDADSFLKNYTLNVEQLLWDGGRILLNRKIERAELTLLETRLGQMKGEIAEGAMGAYREVLSARSVLAIREAALAFLAEQRRILEREVELGLALAMDLAEADITLTEGQIEVLSHKMDLTEREQQFAEILGLEKLPPLAEEIDILRSPALPVSEKVRSMAQERNPDLAAARFALLQKQAEVKYAARAWLPSIRLLGGVNLSGPRYPLTQVNWTVGLSFDFSSPYVSGKFNAAMGWEPPYDRTAQMQGTLSPLPEPASALNTPAAKLALNLEQAKFRQNFETLGRRAVYAAEKLGLMNRQRELALKSLDHAKERLRLAELRMDLGQLTRLDLMEARLEYAQREVAAVEAAAALLGAERELERLLDLYPGELANLSTKKTSFGGSL